MRSKYRGGWELRSFVPASLDAAEAFIARFRGYFDRHGPPGYEFAAELLLRETLTNAIVHGCGLDPAREVLCAVRLDARRLLIAVSDDGGGFDWRTFWRRAPMPEDPSGRGLWIVRKYATRVHFSTHGNAVTVLQRFQRGASALRGTARRVAG